MNGSNVAPRQSPTEVQGGVEADSARQWEDRYSISGHLWPRRVNQTLADIVSRLTPGSALDVGCGEGVDALWLASCGWHTTGLDFSATAIARATEATSEADLPKEHMQWVVHDFTNWSTDERYDLVTVNYFHTDGEVSRTNALRRAAGFVSDGGHLLIVSHKDFPPWASRQHEHEVDHLTAADELASVQLGTDDWETLIAEFRTREAEGPEGVRVALRDTVILLRRRNEST